MNQYPAARVPQPLQPNEPGADLESLLVQVIELLDTAKSMPLSNNVIVPRDDIRDLLMACLENIPLEIRQANWLLRERQEFLAKMEREGDEILRTATERSERLVERSEVVREARRTAQRITDEANDEARSLKYQAEVYVDTCLAEFERTLTETFHSVQAGRNKLRESPPLMDDHEIHSVESAMQRAARNHDLHDSDYIDLSDDDDDEIEADGSRGRRGAFFDQERVRD